MPRVAPPEGTPDAGDPLGTLPKAGLTMTFDEASTVTADALAFPRVGDIVYFMGEGGVEQPAMLCKINAGIYADLHVFRTAHDGIAFRERVERDEAKKAVGTWFVR